MTSAVADPIDEAPEAPRVLLEDNQALIEELAALRQRLLEAGLEPPRILEGGELTPNFSVWEFACNDGTPVPDAALPGLRRLCQDVLQPLRDRFGTCHVTSGFRTEAYNAAVGGATASFHIYTLHLHEQAAAADVYFESGSLSQWAGYADQLLGGGGGVGAYPAQGFLHVDNGPRVWRQ